MESQIIEQKLPDRSIGTLDKYFDLDRQVERNYLSYPGQDPNCVLLGSTRRLSSASVWHDYSTFGNHGTITGATWVRLPSGLWVNSFDGTDDAIDCGASSLFNFTSGDFTLMLWQYTTTVAGQGSWIMRGGYNNQGWQYFRNGDTATFKTDQTGAEQGSSSPPGTILVNKWYQVIVTRITTNVIIYINGADSGNSHESHTDPLTSNYNLTIGAAVGGTAVEFTGFIGLTRIFNRALSATEIAGIFNQERHLFGV